MGKPERVTNSAWPKSGKGRTSERWLLSTGVRQENIRTLCVEVTGCVKAQLKKNPTTVFILQKNQASYYLHKFHVESRYTSNVINTKFKDFIMERLQDLEKDVSRQTLLLRSMTFFCSSLKLFELPPSRMGIRTTPNWRGNVLCKRGSKCGSTPSTFKYLYLSSETPRTLNS